MTEPEVIEKLKQRFPPPEYVLLPQVRNSTGFNRTIRTADALVISTYPSRGIYLYGFEVKSSRSDWLNELKNPAKADEIAQYCHWWYVVTGEKDIVKPDELPPNWGLLEPRGESLAVKLQPKPLEPIPLSLKFLAAVLRKAKEVVTDEAIIQQRINKAVEEAIKNNNQYMKNELERTENRYKDLVNHIKDFEDTSGLSLQYGYGLKELGGEVKFLREVAGALHVGRLEQARNVVSSILESLDDGIKKLTEDRPEA